MCDHPQWRNFDQKWDPQPVEKMKRGKFITASDLDEWNIWHLTKLYFAYEYSQSEILAVGYKVIPAIGG